MGVAISQSEGERLTQPGVKSREKARLTGWKVWLAPRPFTVVSSAVYLGMLYFIFSEYCEACGETWKFTVSLVSLVGSLALDRLDYRMYGDVPPARASLIFMALRFVLAAAITAVLGWLAGAFIFALLPYVATYYFGIRGTIISALASWLVMAVLIALWLIPTLSKVTVVRGSSEYSYYLFTSRDMLELVKNLTLMTIVLVFGAGAARVAYLEKANRTNVERLLVRLEDSNARLRARSEEAIAATEERNRAARDIHDRVGHYLAEVSVQLEKALALTSRDPKASEQAVGNAKQSVSQALHSIRASVASLRRDTDDTSYSEEHDPQVISALDQTSVDEGVRRKPGRMSKWLPWLAPRPFDVVSTTLYLGTLVATLSEYDPESGSNLWRNVGMTVLVLGLVIADRLEFLFFGERPPLLAALPLLGLRLAAGAALFLGLGSWYSLWLIALLPYFCFLYFGTVAGYVSGVLLWVALMALTLPGAIAGAGDLLWGAALQFYLVPVLVLSFFLAIVVATSRIVVKERNVRAQALRLLADLDKAGEELAARTQQALAAVSARNSLARDIHDGLGHFLTAMGVQLEKALAFRDLDPASADRAILDSKRLASEALREIRSTMGTLTLSEPQEAASLVSSLRELVDHLRDSGLSVDMRLEGSDEGYSAQAIMALYRVTQEGITNIRKHSGARNVSLHLWLGERAAQLQIADDGRGFDPDGVLDKLERYERGYGLQNMEERLELVGGSLRVESAPGKGTRLHISVPSVLTIQDKLPHPRVAAGV